MVPPPDFSSLSSSEKDALIRTLLARVDALIAENAALCERLNPRRLCREAGSDARPAPPDRADQPAGTEIAPDDQEVPAEPVRLRYQPGGAADQQRLGTGAAPLRRLPQDHQLLPLTLGSQALCRCQVRLRDRPKTRHSDPSIHPPDPRRAAAAGRFIAACRRVNGRAKDGDGEASERYGAGIMAKTVAPKRSAGKV